MKGIKNGLLKLSFSRQRRIGRTETKYCLQILGSLNTGDLGREPDLIVKVLEVFCRILAASARREVYVEHAQRARPARL